MRRISSILIIVVIILAAAAGVLTYLHMDKNSPLQTTLNAKVLVLCIDPSEGRPGPGAVDMAFNMNLTDGNVTNITPIYPGGMHHPTAQPPDYVKQHNVSVLMLHDTCWWNNTTMDAQLAQETVEYNTGIKTDVVVMVKPEAVDAVLQSIGGAYVNGTMVTNGTIEFVRNEQSSGGMSRGNAVTTLAYAIKNAYKNESKRGIIRAALIDQYNKGNIIVVPNDFVSRFLAADSLNKIFG